MGWNQGFQEMEKQVILAYNANILTPELLDEIMTPYKGTDCDTGGSQNMTSKDGLCVQHIICKTIKPKETKYIEENPVFFDGFEENIEIYKGDKDYLWKANEAADDLFWSIWNGIWEIW